MLSLPQIFLRFRMAIYVYWAMSAAFVGYWVLYFEDKQFSESRIGLMMSLYTIAALAGQYTFGYLSDKLRSIRILVVIAATLFAVAVIAFPLQGKSIWVYPLMAVVGFLQQPIGPMLDTWTLKHLSRYGAEQLFGRIRGLGSLGWASIALLTAYLIAYISWNMMFVVAMVAGLLLSLLAWLIPDAPEVSINPKFDEKDSDELSTSAQTLGPLVSPAVSAPAGPMATAASDPPLTLNRALSHLFGNPAYLYILAVVFFLYLGVQTTFNFQGMLIKDTGGGVIDLGWTFFVGVMSEIPAMFLSVWLLQLMAPRKMMIIAGCLYMLRYALIIYFQTPTIILMTAALEGVAFGLVITALRNYVFKVVAADVQTSAMTVVDAVFLSLTVIVGGAVGGFLIEKFSIMVMLSACMASSALALILLVCGQRFDRYHYGEPVASEG